MPRSGGLSESLLPSINGGGGGSGGGRVASAADAAILFQSDNVRNQHEHLMMLIANRAQRVTGLRRGKPIEEALIVAIQEVFKTDRRESWTGVGKPSAAEPLGTFDNYELWCNHMQIPSGARFLGQPLGDDEGNHRAAEEANAEERSRARTDQLQNLALWWCIWGEAASVRFMPEFLCFIFFAAVQQAKQVSHGSSTVTHLFGHVVQPAFDFLKGQMGQVDRGYSLDHESKMNYDDLNEFFWSAHSRELVRDILEKVPGGEPDQSIITATMAQLFKVPAKPVPPQDTGPTAGEIQDNYLPLDLLTAVKPSSMGDGPCLQEEALAAYAQQDWVEEMRFIFAAIHDGGRESMTSNGAGGSGGGGDRDSTFVSWGKSSHAERRGVFHGLVANSRVWLTYALLFALCIAFGLNHPIPQDAQCTTRCVARCTAASTARTCHAIEGCEYISNPEAGNVPECLLTDYEEPTCAQKSGNCSENCQREIICQGRQLVTQAALNRTDYQTQYPYAFSCGLLRLEDPASARTDGNWSGLAGLASVSCTLDLSTLGNNSVPVWKQCRVPGQDLPNGAPELAECQSLRDSLSQLFTLQPRYLDTALLSLAGLAEFIRGIRAFLISKKRSLDPMRGRSQRCCDCCKAFMHVFWFWPNVWLIVVSAAWFISLFGSSFDDGKVDAMDRIADDILDVVCRVALLCYVMLALVMPGWIAYLPEPVRRRVAPTWVEFARGEMTTSWVTTFYSSLFWCTLVPLKCALSYYLEIVPALKLTSVVWNDDGGADDDSDEQRLFRCLFLALCIWIPTWLLFLLDAQVLYTLLQSFVALVLGLHRGLGGAGFFATSSSGFIAKELIRDEDSTVDVGAEGLQIARNFQKRLDASKDPGKDALLRTPSGGMSQMHPSIRLSNISKVSRSPLPTGNRHQQGITDDTNLFRKCWNEAVHEFRVADLCSFEEEFVLKIPVAWASDRLQGTKNTPLFAVIGAFEYAKFKMSSHPHKDIHWWWRACGKSRMHCQLAVKLVWTVVLRIVNELLAGAVPLNTAHFDEQLLHHFQDEPKKKPGTKLTQFGQKCEAIIDAIVKIQLKEDSSGHSELRKLHLTIGHTPSKRAGNVTAFQQEMDASLQNLQKAVQGFLQFCRKTLGIESSVTGSSWFGLSSRLLAAQLKPNQPDDFLRGEELGARLVALLHHLLRTPLRQALPRNEEIRRRLFYFTNSLTMEMPDPCRVENSIDFSTLVPMYGEEVMYTRRYMQSIKQSGGALSLEDFMEYCEPEEHKNLKQRVHEEAEQRKATQSHESEGSEFKWLLDPQEADPSMVARRLWVSERNQTLCRTIRGMHFYERALISLAEHEYLHDSNLKRKNKPEELKDKRDRLARALVLARHKHCFVVSCQIFGAWAGKYVSEIKKQQEGVYHVEGCHEDASKFESVCWLMHRYHHLRIAFIDSVDGKLYSVLVKHGSTEKDGMALPYAEVYRVELPGNPIHPAGIGEGKPENQNHAIIFTRGTVLQTVDMNQDGYFEEALKMRNLLEEFFPKDSTKIFDLVPERCKPVTIVGFSEFQFSRRMGSAGEFAALEELSFATMAQRAMQCPFEVRYHYGHPDLHHRIRAATRGGIAKAIKTVCVSEDVYGGWNAAQRGGRILFKEYIHVGKGKDLHLDQVAAFQAKIASGSAECSLSRDYLRATETQSLPRLLAFFHTGNGFFWGNVVVVWTTMATMYSYVLLAILLDDNGDVQGQLRHQLSSTVGWLQIGLLLCLPLWLELVLQRGNIYAIFTMFKLICTGAPIFFLFQIIWKSFIFLEALTIPAAQYRATGRGVVLRRLSFRQVFEKYSLSHFYLGVELVSGLFLYGIYSQESPDKVTFAYVTWPMWMMVFASLASPFLYNFKAFDYNSVQSDVAEWKRFIEEVDDLSDSSWTKWYTKNCDEKFAGPCVTRAVRYTLVLRGSFLLIVPVAVVTEFAASHKYGQLFSIRSLPFTILFIVICIMALTALIPEIPKLKRRYFGSRLRENTCANSRWCACMRLPLNVINNGSFVVIGCLVALGILSATSNTRYGQNVHMLPNWLVIVAYSTCWATNTAFYLGYHHHPLVRRMYSVFDICIGCTLLFILWILSLLSPVLSPLQTMLLFNEGVMNSLDGWIQLGRQDMAKKVMSTVGGATKQRVVQPEKRAVASTVRRRSVPRPPPPSEGASATPAQGMAALQARLDMLNGAEPEPEPEFRLHPGGSE